MCSEPAGIHPGAALQAPFWPKDKCIVVPGKAKAALPESASLQSKTSRPEQLSQQGQVLERALLAATGALLEHAEELDHADQR